nr:hypothetical protein [Tanacetum cinerariifolium]
VNTPRSDEDRLKLIELMVFLLQNGVCDDIGITAARLSSYCCQENKSNAAEGFEQIIDFLSGSYIYYALTVNPHIYILCIKQFWNTATVKCSGDVTRLQALVDKKKIVISEAVIREMLQLNDAEGVVCFPNEEIFAGLAQMGYEKPSTKLTFYKAFFSSQWKFLIHTILQSLSAKRTSWNEFSTTMAFAVICLSKGQKFNFSKYIFDSLVRNVDSSSKFYMYPRFIQLIIQNQVGDLSTHTTRFISPDLTQEKLEIVQLKARVKKLEKANKIKSSKLRRLRKVGASRRVKSSYGMEDVFNQGRMIADMDMNEGIELVKDAEVAESEGRHVKKQAEIYNLDLDHSSKVLISAASTTIPAASATIHAAKPTIYAAAPIVVAAYTRKRKGVIIRDAEEELPLKTPAETLVVKDKGKGILVETPKPMKKKDQIEMDAEYARKLQKEIDRDHDGFSKDIDWDAAMDHVNQKSRNPQYIKRYQGMKKRPQTESEARKNMMIYLKNTAGYKMDFFKGMIYAQIFPIFQAMFDENIRKMSEEAQEAEDHRKRLEVVEDEDDDVFVEATPLASKVPIVDYQIVLIDNKPRFKIIRADETHQLYISFATILKNFDREDLETLWRIVKDKFFTSKPTNFSDEYLLLTLKTMFEEPDGQDVIWRNQKSVHGLPLVKRWKLLASCGVHVITLSTV